MKTGFKALGVFLSSLGLGGFIFTLLGIIDLQGSQLANDADPFGSPPTFGQLLIQLGLSAAMLLAGAWLFFRKHRNRVGA